MTQHDEQNPNEPDVDATEAAVALHGDDARAETHEQPATVALPGDTLIATPSEGDVPPTDESDDDF